MPAMSFGSESLFRPHVQNLARRPLVSGSDGVLSPRYKPVLHALEEVKFIALRLHGSLLLHPSGVLRTLLELLTKKDEVTKGLGKSLVFLFSEAGANWPVVLVISFKYRLPDTLIRISVALVEEVVL